VAIHVCTYRSTIRSGFDIQVTPERIAIHGVNGCNGEPGAPPAPLPPVIVDLADLRARRDWSDFALWVVGVDFYANRCFEPFNLYALTAATKYDPQQQAQRDRRSYPIHIFVPTAESDFLDCSIVAYAHPELGLTSNLPVVPRAWTGDHQRQRHRQDRHRPARSSRRAIYAALRSLPRNHGRTDRPATAEA
jgi:hypothetical protein